MALNTSDEAIIEDRRSKAWDLRVKGKSYRAIGEALGVSGATAFADIASVLERTRTENNETAESHKALSLSRLDRALGIVESALDAETFDADGNADNELKLKALDRMLKIEERRAKLLGLDAPAKQEVSGPEGAPIAVDARSALIDRLAGLVTSAAPTDAAGSDPSKPVG